MTQTLNKREAPLNQGGGWASSAPCRTWSSCHRRRRGAPIYKRRQHYGPKAEYEPQRKQPKPRHGPGPWFQPPQSPYWSMYSNWGCWGGPWCPPPMGYRKPPSAGLVARMYGLHPVCLCCCFCWRGPWNPGWARAPVRKKRWGRRGRGLRRQPGRPVPKSPSVEVSPLLEPVNLYGWRAPGLQAPRNTTQFIMNQIYEDMRQQEKLDRQQEALRAQQAQAGGNDVPPSGDEEEAELQDALYGFGQNPSLAFSPAPEAGENHSPAPQPVEEEGEEKYDDECDEEECDGKDEQSEEEESEEEEDEEAEAQDEEEVEEAEYVEEMEEEGEGERERHGSQDWGLSIGLNWKPMCLSPSQERRPVRGALALALTSPFRIRSSPHLGLYRRWSSQNTHRVYPFSSPPLMGLACGAQTMTVQASEMTRLGSGDTRNNDEKV